MEVLEKKRAILSDTLGLVRVGIRDPVAGAVKGVLGRGVAIINVVSVEIAIVSAVWCV